MSRYSFKRRSLQGIAVSAVAAVLTTFAVGAPASSVEAPSRSGETPPPSPRTAGLQQALDQLVNAGAPGALLYTYDEGRVTQLQSGLSDVAAKTPMGPEDRFRVGSLTKSYVSTMVLDLVSQDRLRLTDAVNRYLPGMFADKPRITIQQLLNHTSGIYEHNDDPRVLAPYFAGHLGHVWTPRQLVRIAMSHPLVAPPGAAFHYSNTNYIIAGLIVRAASGRSLAHQLRSELFRPAKLHATTFTSSRRLPAPAVHGYFSIDGDELSDITSLYPYPWASGAAVATASDVAAFYRHLLSGQLLPPRLVGAMKKTVSSAAIGAGTAYGLGLMSFTTRCGKAWGHGGNFPGYVAYALSTPDGSRQAVLLVNADPASVSPVVGRGFTRLLNEAYCG